MRKLQDERYEQQWVVLYQISRSGDILLQGGSLVNETDPGSDPIPLEPVSIVSQGYGLERDSDTPEMLTAESAPEGRSRWVYFLVALAGICVGGYAWWRKNKGSERIKSEPRSPLQETVQGLIEKLEGGLSPSGDLERFLRDHESACSPSLRSVIEEAVYSKTGQMTELKNRLRKEFSL